MKVKAISNKVVATLLCALMLVSSIVVSGVVSSANITDVWDGETLIAPTVGNGSATSPFEISTAKELAYALNAFGKDANGEPAHYKLTADIYINDTSAADWLSDTATKNPWFQGKDKNGYYNLGGSESGAFVGSIDGNGHMVYGLWYPETTGSFASGLIPVFSGSYIRNLGVDKAYIVSDLSSTSGEKGAGVIAGITKGSIMSIDCCFSGADVTVKSNVSGASGIVGAVRNGAEHKLSISNCYSLIPNSNIIMKNEGTDYAADSAYGTYANGIIGNTYQSYFSVTKSYSIAKPYLLNNKNRLSQDCVNTAGTAASEAIITNFADVYSASDVTKAWQSGRFELWGTYMDENTGTAHYVAVQLSAALMQGENALNNMLLGDKFVTTDTYAALKVFVPQSSDEDTNGWDGSLAAPENGEGTAENPYEISTAAQLAYALNEFGKKADETAAHYKLTADIFLNDVSSDSWISNSNNNTWFEGKDKNGYYTLDKSASGAFVGSIDGNGHMVYGIYYPETTGSFASGLIPVFSGSYIRNLGVDKAYIVSDLSSTSGEKGAGAIVGITKGSLMTIDSCFSGANITVKSNVSGASGIVGTVRNGAEHKLTISNCYSLIPNSNIIMKDGTDRAADSAYGTYANGIIGNTYQNYFSVTNSYSIAKPYLLNNKNRLSQDCVNTAGTAASEAIITNFANVYSASDVTKAWQSGRFETWGTYTDGEGTAHYVAVQLSAALMQGENALNNMLLGDKFVTTSSYPILKLFDKGDEGGSGGELEPPVDEDLGPVWNGKVATQLEGKGTKAEPYKITKGSELALAVTMGMGTNKYYSIENDIYLNDVTDKYWYESNENNNLWISDDITFSGYINGNGYIIYGIYYPDDTENKYSGLIPQMNGGSVEGLGIRKSFINSTNYAAGLVGRTVQGKSINIESCFADETVLVNYTSTVSNGGVAGIVGYSNNGSNPLTINNCYSKAVVTGIDTTYRTNGIIGAAWTSDYSIKNAYSTNVAPFYSGSKSATSSAYMPDGVTVITPIEQIYVNVYSDGRQAGTWEYWNFISDSQSMRGELAKTSMPGLDYSKTWKTVEGGTPILKIFEGRITGRDEDTSKDPDNYESGSGTKDDPYIIVNETQLEYLVHSENTKGKYYALGRDINVTKEWFSTADTGVLFSGYIDGRGHFVKGLYVNDTPDPSATKMEGSGTGLFPAVSTSAVIRNIHVRNSQISGVGYVGSIVGKVSGTTGYAEITACSADATVTLKGQTVGGLVGGGSNRGVFMTYSYFTGKIALATGSGEKDHRGNGLIGDLWGSDHIAAECYSVGYQNYRKKAYFPYLSDAIYGTAPLGTTITLTPEQMKGANAKKNMTELNWDLWTVKDGSYPHISVLPTSYTYKFFDNGTKGEVWSGYVAESYASGTGTKEDPYIIETAEQMAKLVIDRNTLGKYYKLACDLYINDVSKSNWKENAKTWMVSSNSFRGYFDGDGHVVYGMYYDTTGAYAGLFTGIGPNGVIEKVGVSEAYILNRGDETNQAYSGGLVANIGSWQSAGEPTDDSYERPIIRQCFVDDTVYIESHYAGGLVGGAGHGVLLENCYFTGEITGCSDTSRIGSLIGNGWSSKNYSIIVNCYVADVDGIIPVYGNSAPTTQYTNTYIDGAVTDDTAAKKMNLIFMHGQHCKENMLGFDFSKIWKPVTDGSPVLRCFTSSEKFSCKRAPKKVEIAFVTNGGEEIESIYGYPRFTKLPELPVPTRYGYEFGGWYYYENCTLPVTIEYFPDDNIYIYAKWIEAGFTQDFEGTLDAEYDYNSGVEHLKPGVLGYIPKYVHGGLKSLHALGDSEVDPIWLVSYENRLEVGKEYELTFYVIAKNEGTTGSLDLIHGNNPQCNTGFVGYETVANLAELEVGVWKEYKYTFTANAPYILFRSSAGADIYVDDISVVPTGKTGELGKIIGFSPDDISAEPITENSIFLIIIIIAGIVLAGGAAITAVVLFRRKRTKGGEVK